MLNWRNIKCLLVGKSVSLEWILMANITTGEEFITGLCSDV
jgi:hypothetical protein